MPVPLSEWESFYVITGTAGAALTGLMFVVIALAADRGERAPADGVGAFNTPTVTHFSVALLLAGIMTVPVHRELTLSVCLGACALFGLTSTTLAGIRMRRAASESAAEPSGPAATVRAPTSAASIEPSSAGRS